MVCVDLFLSAADRSDADFAPAQLYMLAHLATYLPHETDLFFVFVKLQQLINEHFGPERIDKMVSKLMALVRTLVPEIYAHFEEEEVPPNWAVPWLRYLLASQLRANLVHRLWDVYFSGDDGLNLHVYVCVALLRELRDTLLELDGEAIVHTLSRLPQVNIGQLVAQADNLRRDAHEM